MNCFAAEAKVLVQEWSNISIPLSVMLMGIVNRIKQVKLFFHLLSRPRPQSRDRQVLR